MSDEYLNIRKREERFTNHVMMGLIGERIQYKNDMYYIVDNIVYYVIPNDGSGVEVKDKKLKTKILQLHKLEKL